jgi:hypothetical protein
MTRYIGRQSARKLGMSIRAGECILVSRRVFDVRRKKEEPRFTAALLGIY